LGSQVEANKGIKRDLVNTRIFVHENAATNTSRKMDFLYIEQKIILEAKPLLLIENSS